MFEYRQTYKRNSRTTSMKCTNCNNDQFFDNTMNIIDLEKMSVKAVETKVCDHCHNQYFKYNGENRNVKDFRISGRGLSTYFVNVLPEEAEALIREKECAHSGEIIGTFRWDIRTHNTNVYIFKSCYTDEIDSCSKCGAMDFIKPIPNSFYATNNREQKLCDDCAENFHPYHFGYNFRKLKGYSDKYNPFSRYVGIELETIDGEIINYFDIPDSFRDCVASTYDGSLYRSNVYGEEDDIDSPVNSSAYHQDTDEGERGAGREFVTVPLARDKLFKTVDKLSSFLRDHNCKINKSCGMHVHFDMSNESIEDVRKTFLLFSILEDVLFDMLPPSRRDSRFCIPLKKEYRSFFSNDFDSYWYGTKDPIRLRQNKDSKYQNTRYSAINYHALFFHGTLENRMHSGTINPKKIKNWILINQMIIGYAKEQSMKQLLKLSGTKELLFSIIDFFEKKYPVLRDYDLVNYILERTKKFSKDTGRPLKVIKTIKPNAFDRVQAIESFKDFFNSIDKDSSVDQKIDDRVYRRVITPSLDSNDDIIMDTNDFYNFVYGGRN